MRRDLIIECYKFGMHIGSNMLNNANLSIYLLGKRLGYWIIDVKRLVVMIKKVILFITSLANNNGSLCFYHTLFHNYNLLYKSCFLKLVQNAFQSIIIFPWLYGSITNYYASFFGFLKAIVGIWDAGTSFRHVKKSLHSTKALKSKAVRKIDNFESSTDVEMEARFASTEVEMEDSTDVEMEDSTDVEMEDSTDVEARFESTDVEMDASTFVEMEDPFAQRVIEIEDITEVELEANCIDIEASLARTEVGIEASRDYSTDVEIEESTDVGIEDVGTSTDVEIEESTDFGIEDVGTSTDVEMEESTDVGIEDVGTSRDVEMEESTVVGIEDVGTSRDVEMEESTDVDMDNSAYVGRESVGTSTKVEMEDSTDVEMEDSTYVEMEYSKDVEREKDRRDARTDVGNSTDVEMEDYVTEHYGKSTNNNSWYQHVRDLNLINKLLNNKLHIILKQRLKYKFKMLLLKTMYWMVEKRTDYLFTNKLDLYNKVTHRFNKRVKFYWRLLIYYKYFQSIYSLPDAFFFIFPDNNVKPLQEVARTNELITIGLVDTDCAETNLHYPIVSNDDSMVIVFFYFTLLCNIFQTSKLALHANVAHPQLNV